MTFAWRNRIVMKNIHRKILRRFVYVTDQIHWGMREHWETDEQIPETGKISGDCDAFALACRRELRAAGYQDVRLIFCKTELGEYHVVAELDGWIFDNRQRTVMRRDDMRYDWLKISGTRAGEPWRNIKNG